MQPELPGQIEGQRGAIVDVPWFILRLEQPVSIDLDAVQRELLPVMHISSALG